MTHLIKAVNAIKTFTDGVNKSGFINDEVLSSAVLFQFSVIGEAIIHVEKSLLDKYEYSWYKVRGFRNLISHEYFNIKIDAVWNIIENDIPELEEVVDAILKNEF